MLCIVIMGSIFCFSLVLPTVWKKNVEIGNSWDKNSLFSFQSRREYRKIFLLPMSGINKFSYLLKIFINTISYTPFCTIHKPSGSSSLRLGCLLKLLRLRYHNSDTRGQVCWILSMYLVSMSCAEGAAQCRQLSQNLAKEGIGLLLCPALFSCGIQLGLQVVQAAADIHVLLYVLQTLTYFPNVFWLDRILCCACSSNPARSFLLLRKV